MNQNIFKLNASLHQQDECKYSIWCSKNSAWSVNISTIVVFGKKFQSYGFGEIFGDRAIFLWHYKRDDKKHNSFGHKTALHKANWLRCYSFSMYLVTLFWRGFQNSALLYLAGDSCSYYLFTGTHKHAWGVHRDTEEAHSAY